MVGVGVTFAAGDAFIGMTSVFVRVEVRGTAVTVIVGEGEGTLGVMLTFVSIITTGVSATPVVAQEIRINDKSRFSICFMETEWTLVNPLR